MKYFLRYLTVALGLCLLPAAANATCGTSTAAILGGTTAAAGMHFAANGGVSIGNGGFSIANTTTNNDDICLITSAATPLAGVITYAVQ